MLPASIGNRKREVELIVRTHVGPARAITARRIGEMVGIPERAVRALITELILDDGMGEICATVATPPGYFWASCREDAEAYHAVLRARAIEVLRRRKACRHAIPRLPTGRPKQPVLLAP